jgi:lipopolysaccharide export system permease protein
MKIIDKYLVKQFIQTLLFGIVTFVLLFVVINLMEQLGSFVDNNVTTAMVIQYYIYYTPDIIRLILPIAVLLSCLFTSGKMSSLNELTAIKAGGVGLWRYMLPFLVTTFFISIFLIYFSGYVAPEANAKKLYIERTYMGLGSVRTGSNIYFQDSKTRIVTIINYDIERNRALDISIQDFDEKDLTKMINRIDASSMTYSEASKCWNLLGVIKREFHDSSQEVSKYVSLPVKDLNFLPKDIINKQRRQEEMTLKELSTYADEQLKAGNDPTETYIEFHSRIAFAFAPLIVVLFGLPISANKRKGGLALQFGLNLLITFIYLVFMKVSQAFGKNGVLDPIITAWFANFIFLAAALYLIKRSKN